MSNKQNFNYNYWHCCVVISRTFRSIWIVGEFNLCSIPPEDHVILRPIVSNSLHHSYSQKKNHASWISSASIRHAPGPKSFLFDSCPKRPRFLVSTKNRWPKGSKPLGTLWGRRNNRTRKIAETHCKAQDIQQATENGKSKGTFFIYSVHLPRLCF